MARKAVLIGCNYAGTKAELKGCINDVKRMYSCLVDRYGFSEDDIQVLIDTDDSYTQPTGKKKNIRRAITNLIRSADSGDVLFVHYCGHGTHLPAETGDDDDTGYDECIVPTAMNLITDDDFRGFVDQLPAGCRLTIASDSCHSSGLIDEAIEQIGERAPRGKSASASPAPAVAVLVDSRTFSRTGREMPESPPAQKQPEPWKEEKKPEHQPEPTEVREEKTIPLSSPFLSAQRRDSDPSCSSPSIHQHSSSSGEA